MDVTFFRSQIRLPFRDGGALATVEMARALSRRGHRVRFVFGEVSGSEFLDLPYSELNHTRLQTGASGLGTSGFLHRKYQRYWGLSTDRLRAFRDASVANHCDAWVFSGVDGLSYMLEADQGARVWYAMDEMVYAHWTMLELRKGPRPVFDSLRRAVAGAVYEWGHRNVADEIWVVGEPDRRWMRAITGRRRVCYIPNGVDTGRFSPVEVPVAPRRAVFWGRLDFRPNEQALDWFISKVWAGLRERCPDAELWVGGHAPSAHVETITARPGIKLVADVPNLKTFVCSAPVAIFPFVSGGGIKNKLLEAAAMARAVLVSPRVVRGLDEPVDEAWIVCRSPEDWIRNVERIWANPDQAQSLGQSAQDWVKSNYSWDRAAERAERSLFEAVKRARVERP